MARRITVQRYPLLKVTLPLAVVIAGIGIYLFISHTVDCAAPDAQAGLCTAGQSYNDRPTGLLMLWVIPAALVAIAGALVKKKDEMTFLFPTDQLKESSRADLQKVLDGLEEARRKGELPEDRYVNARNRVLAEMKGK
jgi:hypothetical protein